MTVKRTISQDLKVVVANANANTLTNDCSDVVVIVNSAAAVTITETSTVFPALDAAIPLDRLVFNPKDLAAARVVIDAEDGTFVTTQAVAVGLFESALHNGVKVSHAATVLLNGAKTPNGA